MADTSSSDQPILSDEEFARQLQEQFEQELKSSSKPKQDEQFQKDLELAQQLSQGNETTSTDNNKGGDKQFELDMMLALKLQEEEYIANEKKKIKPAPVPTYTAPIYSFSRQQPDADRLPPTPECVKRITTDMKEVLKSGNKFIYIAPDEEDITHIQALIVGPPDTPYAYGFFHFDMIFPHDYPWRPPKVQLITTDGGRVRFNPNLYSNGKVCLSILGTWSGPAWTQIQTITSTLLSIQSLMNPTPYHNEPGYESERKEGDVVKYNQCITHETIRVAVCGMLEFPTCGNLFAEEMEELFLEHYNEYETVCINLQNEFDGMEMEDPFREKRGTFDYASILVRLRKIKERIENKKLGINTEPVSTVSTTTVTMDTNENTVSMETESNTDVTNNSTEDFSVTNNEVQPVAMETEVASVTNNEEKTVDDTTNNSNSLANSNSGALEQKLMDFFNTSNNVTGNTNTSNEATNATGVTGASGGLDYDEELARILQEQMYQEIANEGGNYFGGSYDYQQSYSANKNYYGNNTYNNNSNSNNTVPFTPVKPPSMKELIKEDDDETTTIHDPETVCLVCHQSPNEYIIIPTCQQPHVYCMSCASKMLNNKQHNPMDRYNYNRKPKVNNEKGSSIKCVLCSSVAYLDSVQGLSALKRRKKRKIDSCADPGKCNIHKEEELCLYCMDCQDLLCFSCAGNSSHSRHRVEALDVAQQQIQSQINNNLESVKDKREKLANFVGKVTTQAQQLPKSVDVTIEDAKSKFAALRKLLDEKEAEIMESIKKLQQTKQRTIESETKKAQEQLLKIEQSIQDANKVMKENSLNFLQNIDPIEEQLRLSVASNSPETKAKWFEMPQVYPHIIEQSIKALKYKDRNLPPGSYDYNAPYDESYSDEEDY